MIVEITLKLWKAETNSLALEHVILVNKTDMVELQTKLKDSMECSITSLPTALAALETMIAKEEAGMANESEYDIKHGSLSELIASSLDPKTTH